MHKKTTVDKSFGVRKEKKRKLASLAEPVRIRDAFQAYGEISEHKFALKKPS